MSLDTATVDQLSGRKACLVITNEGAPELFRSSLTESGCRRLERSCIRFR